MRALAVLALTCAPLWVCGCGGKAAPPQPAAGPDAPAPAPAPVPSAPPGESVENPQYASWAKFPPGTLIVQRTTSETEGVEGKTVTTLTTKLIEVAPEFVKLESQSSSRRFDGHEETNPPGTFKVPRLLVLPTGMKKEDFGKPAGAKEQGEEAVAVAGREYKARWYTGKDRNEGGEVSVKTWVSDEVPGTLLKSVSRTTGVKKLVTIELVEFKVPGAPAK